MKSGKFAAQVERGFDSMSCGLPSFPSWKKFKQVGCRERPVFVDS